MTWVRIDDSAPIHPKLLDAGAEAAWLWVAGLAHANRHATDGRIEKHHLEALYPPLAKRAHRLARTLCELGLWTDDGANAYWIHDYAEYQEEALRRSREARKEAARERKRKQRQKNKAQNHPENGGSHAVTPRDMSRPSHSDSHAGRHATGHASSHGDVYPDMSHPPGPSRPVPARPGNSSPDGDAHRARAREASSNSSNGQSPDPYHLLIRGYCERYERETGEPWMSAAANQQQIREVARWVEARAAKGHEPQDSVTELLDAFFTDSWARSKSWPWKALAKDPGRYLRGTSSSEPEDPDKRERLERLRALAPSQPEESADDRSDRSKGSAVPVSGIGSGWWQR